MLRRLDLLSDRFRRSALALPLSIGLAVAALGFSEWAFRSSSVRLEDTVEVGRARIETLQVLQLLSTLESSQRGYLLTGHRDYLLPYEAAVAALPVHERSLRDWLVAGDLEEALPQWQALVDCAAARVAETREVLRLHDSGEPARARELVMTGIGRDQMDAARQAADALLQSLNLHIRERLDGIQRTFVFGRAGVAALVLASLLALALFLRVARRYDLAREAQQQQLQQERDSLETQVVDRTAELTELARHLETTREDERARIARDLHDELGALLTAAKLDVARIRPGLQQQAPQLLPRLNHLIEQLNAGIALKRRIIEDLRPSTLENLGLQPALEICCSEAAARMALPVTLDFSPVRLGRGAELTVYRMVQESLNNIAKHAQARSVRVSVRADGEQAEVCIRDDGCGFDPSRLPRATHGLLGMRYRVAAERGTLHIDSRPGAGTTMTARLPQQTDAGAQDPAGPPDDGGPAGGDGPVGAPPHA
ncbi:MAG: hypothetical protein RLY78_84 [Pseudomonadota bacterium]|jgi:signal transduction histidine kinase